MTDEQFTDNSLLVRALFEGQRDLGTKIDALNAYMREHMAKEETEIANIRVEVATLKEQVSGQGKKWGAVSTVITSVLSALGVSLFVSQK